MNFLKVNLKIGIEYFSLGNTSNPDIQVEPKNLNSLFMFNEKPTVHNYSPNKKINIVTHISGPHRTQSCDQSNIPPKYENIGKKEKGKLSIKKENFNSSPKKEKTPIAENISNLSFSYIDPLLNDDRDNELEFDDTVTILVNDILNTYNDNLLNK